MLIWGSGCILSTISSVTVGQLLFPSALNCRITSPLAISVAEGVYIGFGSFSVGLNEPLPEVLQVIDAASEIVAKSKG